MADAITTRKLLLKYFATAPRAELEPVLEIMYGELSPAQKSMLLARAKAYLLPRANQEVVAAENSLSFFQGAVTTQSGILNTTLTDAQTLVVEIESL